MEIPYDARVEELHHDTVKHNFLYHSTSLFLVDSNSSLKNDREFFKLHKKEIKEFEKNEKRDWKAKNFVSYLMMSDLENIYSYLKLFKEDNKFYIKDIKTNKN